MNPLVSIIITAYNQEKFIAETIQSVVSQSYAHWECIIIDDGSTDNTRNICNEFVQKDSRIIYTYQHNQGVSTARNNGFELSRGTFVQFLDGDDYLHVEKLKIQIEFLASNPDISVCYSDHLFYIQQENRFVRHQFKILSGIPFQEILFDYDNGVSIPIHSALIRKDIFDSTLQIPFTTEYHYRYEDWVFWVRLVLNNARFHFIDQPLCVYRMHKGNFCNNESDLTFHALRAVEYIGGLLDQDVRKQFVEKKSIFILNRLVVQSINKMTIRSLMSQLLQQLLIGFKHKKSKLGSAVRYFHNKR